MDVSSISAFKEIGIAIFSVGVVGYILREVILSLREEHKANQAWFMGYVNENNHQKTELVTKVAQNIEKNTMVTFEFTKSIEQHNKIIEKLVDKLK